MSEKQTPNVTGLASGRKVHPFKMWDGIEAVPSIVGGCLGGEIREAAWQVAKEIKKRGIRRVYLFGCGTSYFAGASIAMALAELVGIDADSYNGFEFGRYKSCSIDSKSAVIAVSHSGHTKVDIEALDNARKIGALTICLTDVADSPLARTAELVVPGVGGRDPSLPKTRSYQAALVKGYQIAALIEDDQEALGEINKLPELLKNITGLTDVMKELGEKHAQFEQIMVVGGGPNAQTAFEVALKFKEAALVGAEGLEIEEAIHGPVVTLDEKTLLIAISSPGASYEKIGDFCRAAVAIGSPVISVTTHPYNIEGVTTVEVKASGLREIFTPPLLAYPMQMMVYWMSIARGIIPDVIRTDNPKYKRAMDIVMPPGSH